MRFKAVFELLKSDPRKTGKKIEVKQLGLKTGMVVVVKRRKPDGE